MGFTKECVLNRPFYKKNTCTSRRKILLVHTGASFGGVDVYLANLIELLKDCVDIYFFSLNRQSGARFADLGATNIGPNLGLGRTLSFTLFALWLPVLRIRLGIDTLWAQGGMGICLFPIARLLGTYTVHTRHSRLHAEPLQGLRGVKHRLMEFLVRLLMRLAHRTICVSKTVAGDMLDLLPQSSISVIPNWVKLPVLPSRGERRNCELRVLFVGRLEQFKGAGFLIEAVRRIEAEKSGVVWLTIVGEGPYRPELEKLAEGLPVTFEGFQRDSSAFYQRADVFVNPSLSEGMSLTSLEAMSYGLPCILSDIPSNREVVGDQPAALLFRAGDATDLAAKLTMCLSCIGLLSSLGRGARSLVCARFCPEVSNTAYLRALNLS